MLLLDTGSGRRARYDSLDLLTLGRRWLSFLLLSCPCLFARRKLLIGLNICGLARHRSLANDDIRVSNFEVSCLLRSRVDHKWLASAMSLSDYFKSSGVLLAFKVLVALVSHCDLSRRRQRRFHLRVLRRGAINTGSRRNSVLPRRRLLCHHFFLQTGRVQSLSLGPPFADHRHRITQLKIGVECRWLLQVGFND